MSNNTSSARPESMNLGEMQDRLADVKYISAFLQRVVMNWNETGFSASSNETEGFIAVLQVIQDKAELVSAALTPAKGGCHDKA